MSEQRRFTPTTWQEAQVTGNRYEYYAQLQSPNGTAIIGIISVNKNQPNQARYEAKINDEQLSLSGIVVQEVTRKPDEGDFVKATCFMVNRRQGKLPQLLLIHRKMLQLREGASLLDTTETEVVHPNANINPVESVQVWTNSAVESLGEGWSLTAVKAPKIDEAITNY